MQSPDRALARALELTTAEPSAHDIAHALIRIGRRQPPGEVTDAAAGWFAALALDLGSVLHASEDAALRRDLDTKANAATSAAFARLDLPLAFDVLKALAPTHRLSSATARVDALHETEKVCHGVLRYWQEQHLILGNAPEDIEDDADRGYADHPHAPAHDPEEDDERYMKLYATMDHDRLIDLRYPWYYDDEPEQVVRFHYTAERATKKTRDPYLVVMLLHRDDAKRFARDIEYHVPANVFRESRFEIIDLTHSETG